MRCQQGGLQFRGTNPTYCKTDLHIIVFYISPAVFLQGQSGMSAGQIQYDRQRVKTPSDKVNHFGMRNKMSVELSQMTIMSRRLNGLVLEDMRLLIWMFCKRISSVYGSCV